MSHRPNGYCPHCGYGVPTEGDWPRTCEAGHFVYNSPKPVVALVIPCHKSKENPLGVLVIKRGIEPYKGEWAFPGGYIDHAEDWRDAAVREAQEEVGVTLDPAALRLTHVRSTPNNFLVMFVEYEGTISEKRWAEHDLTTTLNDTGEQEIAEIAVWGFEEYTDGQSLGVPAHDWYFRRMTFI